MTQPAWSRRCAVVAAGAMSVVTGVATAAEKTPRDHGLRSGGRAVRLLREGDYNLAVFDAGIDADTPDAATRAWLDRNRRALGSDEHDLRLERRGRLGRRRATVFAYRQFIDGLPVEGGLGRLLVSPGGPHRVTYGGFKLARRPAGGFAPDRVTAAEAFDSVRDSAAFGHLPDWTQPELVVLFTDDDLVVPTDAIRAWKFSGHDLRAPQAEAYTFFVDAADGTLAHVREEIYDQSPEDITGFVKAFGSPGTFPTSDLHRFVTLPIEHARVRNAFGAVTYSQADGSCATTSGGFMPTSITVDLMSPWVHLQDDTAPIISESVDFDAVPVRRDFLLNFFIEENLTAQVDAFIHANKTHDFMKERQPSFTEIDIPLTTIVNRPAHCNAFFTPVGLSINFLSAGAGCVNSAYSTVVAHEYGHFVVDRLGLFQGSFGEGYSDSLAILIYDDPIIGRDFFGPDTYVRDIVGANRRYPCFGEVHDCGQVLAGVWWDLKLELQQIMGDAEGLEFARQLFTDWSMITVGGSGRNSAHRQTAVEVLIADDDNADLADGTPHKEQICTAFTRHNIPCPGLCSDVNRIRATCRSDLAGAFTVRATVSTDSGRGADLTVLLDGRQEQSLDVSWRGRASATWRDVGAGTHEVCIRGCGTLCEEVRCGW